ncbi:MAG: ParA family protein [Pirellulaceae bacterium]
MWEFIDAIPQLLDLSWGSLAKVVLGAGIVGVMALGWVRSIREEAKAKAQSEEHQREAQVARARSDFDKQIAELKTQHAEEVLRLREQAIQSENERETAATTLEGLQKRLSDLESFDGKLWEQNLNAQPTPFVMAADRKTRFISVMNLKGGVGKTTLTANIGVSLARRGHRVLLVDLDFQSSLTRLCKTSSELLLELIRTKKTAGRLLGDSNGTPPVNDLIQIISHPNLTGHTCRYIAADESLAEIELRAQARWLVTGRPDARFLFREWFHEEEVLKNYDFVLFDCPPRLTTACVNALSCSDYLLVPVLLEQGSVEALPRTLNWLNRLPHVAKAQLLGVVANRVDLRLGQPIAVQQTIYKYLPETLKRAGFQEQHVFRAIVKNQRAIIEDSANRGAIAATEDSGLELFASVTDEVEKGVLK